MIPKIELAEAECEAAAARNGTEAGARLIVTCHRMPVRFVLNHCGYFANFCTDEDATRFDTIHEAGAACRRARMTGPITIEPAKP